MKMAAAKIVVLALASIMSSCCTTPPQESTAHWIEIARLDDVEEAEYAEDPASEYVQLIAAYHETLRRAGITHRLVRDAVSGSYYFWVSSDAVDAARSVLAAETRTRPVMIPRPLNHGPHGMRLPCPCGEEWMGESWTKIADFNPHSGVMEYFLTDCLRKVGVYSTIEGSQVYWLFVPGPMADKATAALAADPRFQVYSDMNEAGEDGFPDDMLIFNREPTHRITLLIELNDFLWQRMSPWW